MDRLSRIATRAKAQGSHKSPAPLVRDGVADKVAADRETALSFFRGDSGWF
jgi:hypothetical protein